MEMKFEETMCRHLSCAVDQVQCQEQTQEVRLPDSMPDIGRVLGTWGSVIVRSKEWRGSGMTVSGGVMAWVLYAPEDGSEPRSMEVWIPYQLKWDFPETRHDGAIFVSPRLKSIDARSTSARKLMVRANVCARGQGLETTETPIYNAREVPEDVQLLRAVYPMELPCESGEKMVEIQEEPEGLVAEKILRYDVTPYVLEQKVMVSRLVFRGKVNVHIVYLSDGKVHTWDCELPFSQFADLDREYGSSANGDIQMMMTNMEVEQAEGRLQVKCAMAAQFVIFDRQMVEIVEDAYSPVRAVQLQKQQLQLPARLDVRTETANFRQNIHASAEKIVDAVCYADHPARRQNGDQVQFAISGMSQVLYYDETGSLQCGTGRFQQDVTVASDAGAAVDGSIDGNAMVQVNPGQELEVDGNMMLRLTAQAGEGQWMISALELGEKTEPDENRPSLILRRFGDVSLWAMAKESGSTVEAIRKANGLTEEPEKGKVLLIPVS